MPLLFFNFWRIGSFVFSIFFIPNLIAQSLPFEGIITYKHSEIDSHGNPSKGAIDYEDVFFANQKMLNQVTDGDLLEIIGSHAILFDCNKMKRYRVDYKRLNLIEIEPDVEEINQLSFTRELDEKVLDYTCHVYLLKYIHSYNIVTGFGEEERLDTLTTRYYVSPDLVVPCIKEFAALQGNRNTKLLDGRFEGIPIKIMIERTNGSRTLIEAQNIVRKNVDEKFNFISFK
jgi:hypothetical protein